MVKLTKAQRDLLADVASGDDACTDRYRPAISLVKAGLLIWRAENRLEITPSGRCALDGGGK